MILGHVPHFHGVIVSADEAHDVLHECGPQKTKAQALQSAKDHIAGVQRHDRFVESQDGTEVKVFTRRGRHCATIITKEW